MQLSQRSDDSPGEKDDQDHEYRLTVNESLGSPLVRFARPPINIPQDAAAAISSGSVSAPSRALPDLLVSQKTQTTTTKSTAAMSTRKPADVTPRPKVPRQPSALIPATPSQNRVLHKDAFGSDGTDLSELSDDSEADSMKALSQKVAARTGSLVAVTKHASVLADAVPSAGVSGKKTAKRRVLDSEEEQVLSNSRKGAKGGSKPGVRKPKKALPTVVASDVEDDVPPAPAPLKSKAFRMFPQNDHGLIFLLQKEGVPKLLRRTLNLSMRKRNRLLEIRSLQKGRGKTRMTVSKLEKSLMFKKNHPPLSEQGRLLAGNLVLPNQRLFPLLPLLLRETLRF